MPPAGEGVKSFFSVPPIHTEILTMATLVRSLHPLLNALLLLLVRY
jgi:hypothetical protein